MNDSINNQQSTINRKFLNRILLFTVFCLLFFVYSFLPLSQLLDSGTRGVHLKFDTPDEMINYAFAENFQKTSRLYYLEYLNEYLPHPIVFPRWARPDGAFVYPGAFLGMIVLYGSIAKAAGTVVIPFLTPIVSLLNCFIVFLILRRVFGRNIAMWSALILALFPVYVYYASRTMFHTVLFLFFVLLGVWLYLKAFSVNNKQSTINKNENVISTEPQGERRNLIQLVFMSIMRSLSYAKPSLEMTTVCFYLSALSFGLALFIRFADIWWMVLTIGVLFIYRRMDLKRNVLFWLIFLFSLFPTFYLNNVLYGNWLDFGYSTIAIGGSGSGVSSVLGFVLPFGFHPRVMWSVFVNVIFKPYWWFFVLGLLGYALIVKDFWKNQKKHVLLFSVYCFLFPVYLLSFYGSWKFSDSIDPNVVAISSSYYRYFLPLFVLVIPFAGYAISKIVQYVIASDRKGAWRSHSGGQNEIASSNLAMTAKGCFFLVFLFSCFLVFSYSKAYLGEEGLLHVRRQVLWYREQVKMLQSRGASYNDLFLVRRGEDKMLLPEFPKVVNVDYIDPILVEESLEKYTGVVWRSKNGVFQKAQHGLKTGE